MNDRPLISELPPEYAYDENGFLKQIVHYPFEYTQEYKDHQSTNVQMSFLRLGWVTSFFDFEEIRSMEVVDVGCGNGTFVKSCSNIFGNVYGYDVAGESISEERLYGKAWDLAILSDVLEHFDDIEDLFKINWKYCMLSFPEVPPVEKFSELMSWRHFKPNEHIYYLYTEGVRRWVGKRPEVSVLGQSNFEDLLRTRWDKRKVNITTLLLKRQIEDESSFHHNTVSQ